METKLRHNESNVVNVNTVDKFDLEKYLGVWYEIARYDHGFERGLSKVKAEYTLRGNGMIKVVNTGYDGKRGKQKEVVGKAKVTDVPGLLRVSFFWIFYSDYRILCIDDNYSWAIVSAGHSDKYLWILSRTEKLTDDAIKNILFEVEKRGFNTKKLIFI
jgi:lipocalin